MHEKTPKRKVMFLALSKFFTDHSSTKISALILTLLLFYYATQAKVISSLFYNSLL